MLGQDYKLLGFMHPYGLCMAIGIICCFLFLMFTMTKKNFNEEAIDKMLLIGIAATGFGVLMAAIVQGIYEVLAGGKFSLAAMTFQGGLIGGVVSFLAVWNIYIFVIAPKTKIKLLQNNMNATLSDAIPFVPPAITIAHAFGRLGCTFAGCCHGAETDAWFGINMYINGGGVGSYGTPVKVVPTNLFECLFLVFLSALMIILYYKFKFKYNFPLYLIVYGAWRFGLEFVRADYRAQFAAITPSQIMSIIMVVGGVAFIFLQYYVLNRLMKHPELQPPVRQSKAKEAAANDAPSDGANKEDNHE